MVRAIVVSLLIAALIAVGYLSLSSGGADLTVGTGPEISTATPTGASGHPTDTPIGEDPNLTETTGDTTRSGTSAPTQTTTPAGAPTASETRTPTPTRTPLPVRTQRPTPTPETPTPTPAIDTQVTTPAPPVTAQAAETDAPRAGIESRFAPEAPGGAVHTITFAVPDDITRLALYRWDDSPILNSSGLEPSGGRWVRWDGTTANPSITVRGAEISEDRLGTLYHVDDDWAVVPVPSFYVYYTKDGERRSYYARDSRHATHEVDGVGTGASPVVYFGPYDEHTRHVDGQTLRLIIPEQVSLEDRPSEVLDSVADARRRLTGGDDDPEISMLVAPEPVREGGYAGGKGFVVGTRDNVAPTVHEPNNVWIHEYVHTARSFDPGPQLEWFTEADAEYGAARTTYVQRAVTGRSADSHLRRGAVSTSVLADAATWVSPYVPYHEGAAVLYVLDWKIRDATGGERTLEDVVALMEQNEGEVTYLDFKAYVAEVAGTTMDGWLDEHVLADNDIGEIRGRNGYLQNTGRIYAVEVTETESTVDVTVSVDPTADHGDYLSDGDPYLEVLIDGRSVATTQRLPWELHHEVTVSEPREGSIPPGGPLSVTVILWDGDVLEDDQLDVYEVRFPIPVTPTPSPPPENSTPTPATSSPS